MIRAVVGPRLRAVAHDKQVVDGLGIVVPEKARLRARVARGGSARLMSGSVGFHVFCGFWSPLPCPRRLGAKKKPLRFEHRRGGSLISDQSPRGACSDETMTATAEEAVARAPNEALPERIIDAGQRRRPGGPCQVEAGRNGGPAGINGIPEYS